MTQFCPQKAPFWFLLTVFLLLTACGGGSSTNVISLDHRGQLLGKQLLRSVSPGALVYGVKTYRIIYATTAPDNHLIKASGILAIPQKASGEKSPLLSYQHGTNFLDRNAPSNSASTISGINTLAKTGFIVSAADYIGYGAASSSMHPYMHADSLASSSLDMLRAAKTFLAENHININSQLFVTGYSEGGYATLALQKNILEKHSAEFKVTASSAGAGPYDLVETAKILAGKVINEQPAYMSFLIKAYDQVYSLNQINTIFQPQYVNIVNTVFDGEHSGGAINEQLSHATTELFKASFLDALQGNGDHPLLEKLAENKLYDWKPEAPTRLFHSPSDEIVPYANSQKALETMRSNGAPQIDLVDCVLDTHVDCAAPYVLDTLVFFLRYADDL